MLAAQPHVVDGIGAVQRNVRTHTTQCVLQSGVSGDNAMKTTPCECDAGEGAAIMWCPRHRVDKIPRLRYLCATDSAFFDQGERGEMPQQQPDYGQPHATAGSLPCVHRGDVVRRLDCGQCGGRDLVLDVHACALHDECTIRKVEAGTAMRSCLSCDDRTEAAPRHVVLHNGQSPGDIVVLTAAVRALHQAYPREFQTSLDTPCPDLYPPQPEPDDSWERVEVKYDDIVHCSQRPTHFLQATCDGLADALKVPRFYPRDWREPSILLTHVEKSWIPQVEGDYWIVCSGVKRDYTAKRWLGYQRVVDLTRDKIKWVQVGSLEHDHAPLEGVIDLRGQTDLRQLVRLVYHAKGVLCGVTALMHLAHFVERPSNGQRHAVVVAGGREPVHWFNYPGHAVLSTIGMLQCCRSGGCWRSRVTPLGDGDSKDRDLCEMPRGEQGRCMEMIEPELCARYCLTLATA